MGFGMGFGIWDGIWAWDGNGIWDLGWDGMGWAGMGWDSKWAASIILTILILETFLCVNKPVRFLIKY